MKNAAWRIIIWLVALICCVACSALQSVESSASETQPAFPQEDVADESGVEAAVEIEALNAAADADHLLLTRLYERLSPSVVSIESATRAEDGRALELRRGSGFVFDQLGHIISNAHLVKDADSLTVTLQGARVLEAALIGEDSFSDLAVLKVEAAAERLIPALLGESAGLKVGQRAISIGSPFGLDHSMTVGIISGLGRSLRSADLIEGEGMPGYDNPAIIQIDTPIHPGMSGAPLLDSGGAVIGITTAMRSDNGVFQGVGFAVPADTMRRVIPDLIARGVVDYAWLGLSVMREDGGFGVAGLSQPLELPVERGVLLSGVSERSPAHLAGLRGGSELVEIRGKPVCAGGDIIVAIDDYHIQDLDDLNAYLIQRTRPGDEIRLLVIRGGAAFEAELTLQARPLSSEGRTLDCNTAA